jgi:hypothetical protein
MPRSDAGRMGRLQQFIFELKRRRVIRVMVGWGVFSFAVLQIYEPVMHGLHLPEWTLSLVVLGSQRERRVPGRRDLRLAWGEGKGLRMAGARLPPARWRPRGGVAVG